jgi:hypothetical protein
LEGNTFMDSAHRHELQTNEMEKLARQAVPFFERYGNQIAIGICVVSVALSAWIYFGRTSYNNRASAWTNLGTATSSAEFADVADRFPGTTAAPYARLLEADTLYAQGFKAMFSNREASLVDLKKAKDAYALLVSGGKVDPAVRERALFGLSRTQECLSNGDLTEAVKSGEQLLKEFPESIFKAEVEEQLARLKSGGTQEFYAWFSKKDPKPAPPKKPDDKVGGETGPSLPGSGPVGGGTAGPALPAPTLPIPEAPSADGKPAAPPTLEIPTDKPADAKPADAKPETTPAPAATPEKPADEKPAPEKPAGDKPAVEAPPEEKPAADKPAADKPAAETPPAAEKPTEKPEAAKEGDDKPAEPKPAAPEPKPEAESKPDSEKPAEKSPE